MLTPRQTRAARVLLDWKQDDLAKAAGLAVRTVLDFENENRKPSVGTKAALAATLERHGIALLAGEGVQRAEVRRQAA